MDKRKCSICKEVKDITEFSKKGKKSDGTIKYQHTCKKCMIVYRHEWYEKNKQKVRAHIKVNEKRYKNEAHKLLAEIKMHPCTDCGGVFHPWAMEFDHIIPENKKYNVGSMVGGKHSIKAIEKEIAKCERRMC